LDNAPSQNSYHCSEPSLFLDKKIVTIRGTEIFAACWYAFTVDKAMTQGGVIEVPFRREGHRKYTTRGEGSRRRAERSQGEMQHAGQDTRLDIKTNWKPTTDKQPDEILFKSRDNIATCTSYLETFHKKQKNKTKKQQKTKKIRK